MSSGFRPRDYKLLKGGATLGIGNPKSLFTEKKEAQEMPELEWGGRVPLFLHDKGDVDIAVCTLFHKAPLPKVDKLLNLINSLLSKAKTSFDAIFANKSLMSNTKAQEMANTVFNYMERKPEFEVLQTLQMKTNNQDGATGGGGGGSGSGGGASHYNVASRHSVSGASSRADRLFGVDLMTGAVRGREDLELTSPDSRRTFALAQGLLEHNEQLFPGYPAEIHIKSANSYQSVYSMGDHMAFYEHVFLPNAVHDNSLPAIIMRMEKQALDTAKFKQNNNSSNNS